jgi:hypothetical protein
MDNLDPNKPTTNWKFTNDSGSGTVGWQIHTAAPPILYVPTDSREGVCVPAGSYLQLPLPNGMTLRINGPASFDPGAELKLG